MKILELFGEPISRGGQESYVINTLKHMNLDGLNIDLLTPYYCDNENYRTYMKSIGGYIYSFNLKFLPGGSRKNIINPLKNFLKNHKYDVVHIHSGSLSVLAYGAMVVSRAGIQRVIVHSHSSGCRENIKHMVIKWYANLLFQKYVDIFCACSPAAAHWKFSKSIISKTYILKNGVDIELFSYNFKQREFIRKKYKISDTDFLIGHVGRFTYEKNQKFLIKLLKRYLKLNKEAKLMLVGDGDCLEEVKTIAEKYNLRDKVVFVGAVDNVFDYMQAFDLFAFPSLYEGLGIVGIEAQAAGLPVIASSEIPKDMKVTNNVEFVQLDNLSKWCDCINKYVNFERKSMNDFLSKAGYDVVESASKLREIYFLDAYK